MLRGLASIGAPKQDQRVLATEARMGSFFPQNIVCELEMRLDGRRQPDYWGNRKV